MCCLKMKLMLLFTGGHQIKWMRSWRAALSLTLTFYSPVIEGKRQFHL